MRTRSRSRIGTVLLTIAILALIVTAFIVVATHHNARAEACREQGGTVHVDHDTKRVKGSDGKYTTRTTTEYECIIDGREAFEW